MTTKRFGLLEFGSNSLKYYAVDPETDQQDTVETHKVPWRICHEYFSQGLVGSTSIDEMLAALSTLRAAVPDIPTSRILSVATGVFREVDEIREIARRFQVEGDVRLRVISGNEEARLMARGYRERDQEPVLLCDLGGATTEWALVENGKAQSWGSVPVGAIRMRYVVDDDDAEPDSDRFADAVASVTEKALSELPIPTKARVLVTGGTARAAACCAGEAVLSTELLESLVGDVRHNGAPENLDANRRDVFIPGLLILAALASRFGGGRIECAAPSVRDGLAARLLLLLRMRHEDDLRSTLLLRTHSAL